MKRMVILEGWNSYRREVIPKEAGPVQIEETRRGFYAGAAYLFLAIQAILDPGAEPTDKDIASMQAIFDELQEFVDAVKARRAG